MRSRYEMRKPGVLSSQCRREEPSRSPSNTTKQGGRSAEQSVPRSEMLNFLKLKEEVVKHAKSYIQRCALAIGRTLTPDHEAVKCLSAFGDQAQKFAAEILATIEWGTQHEAPGVLPGTPGAQMAMHAGICPDDDAHARGTAIGSPGRPL